jgi:signal transduction histidine kinase
VTTFDELRRIPLFDGLSETELEGVLEHGSEKVVAAGEVTDDGPGIPQENHARIFEPFFSTKDVAEGRGLGLDVSYRIVVGRHGGDIHVVSEPGETRFEVRLPVDGPGDPEAVADRDLRMEAGA